MENDQTSERAQVPASASVYPALSISKPPPPRERVMKYILTSLFAAAFLLAIAGVVAHWLQAP